MPSPERSPENNHPAASEKLEEIELHNRALIAEKWAHDVTAFREAIVSRMSPYVQPDGTAWGYFEMQERDDLGGDPREKDMVILLVYPEKKGERGLPIIRIMTNEMIAHENTTQCIDHKGTSQCLAQDLILDQEGDAWFMVDAALMSGWDKKGYAKQKTSAPVYLAQGDNNLVFQNLNAQPLMQTVMEPGLGLPVIPFGHFSNQSDRQFALDTAWQLLEAVWDDYPKYSSTAD